MNFRRILFEYFAQKQQHQHVYTSPSAIQAWRISKRITMTLYSLQHRFERIVENSLFYLNSILALVFLWRNDKNDKIRIKNKDMLISFCKSNDIKIWIIISMLNWFINAKVCGAMYWIFADILIFIESRPLCFGIWLQIEIATIDFNKW